MHILMGTEGSELVISILSSQLSLKDLFTEGMHSSALSQRKRKDLIEAAPVQHQGLALQKERAATEPVPKSEDIPMG